MKDFFKTHEVLHYLSNDSIKEKNRERLKSDILSPEEKWSLKEKYRKIFKGIAHIIDILNPSCLKLTYSFLKHTCELKNESG